MERPLKVPGPAPSLALLLATCFSGRFWIWMTTPLAPSKFPLSLTLLGGSPTGVWPSFPGSKGGPGWLRGSSGEAVTQGAPLYLPLPTSIPPLPLPPPPHHSVSNSVRTFPNLLPGLASTSLAVCQFLEPSQDQISCVASAQNFFLLRMPSPLFHACVF